MSVDPNLLDDLEGRGLIHQIAEPKDAPLRKLLEEPQVIYCGFDPTASSLHLGHLIPLFALRRFQLAGHKVIALAGGATGMVGDPSGKSEERQLLTKEVLEQNLAGVKQQLSAFLDFEGDNPALLVNNLDWTEGLSLLEFLRDVGKHFFVNVMIKKDSVKDRLAREGEGLSFTEFSYSLLQGFDFFWLNQNHGCKVQIGGSDQYGNIVAGTDLIRRKNDGERGYGLTLPLLLKADGTKFGKSAKGTNVWIDPARTSPWAFRQFWFNQPDDMVITLLKRFTFLPLSEIAKLEETVGKGREAQRALAVHMTGLVHGEETATQVEKAAEVFFNPKADLREMPVELLEDAFSEAPTTELARSELEGEGKNWLDLVVEVAWGGANKRGQARKDIQGNAMSLNGQKLTDPEAAITTEHLVHDRYLVIRKGKKSQFLVKLK